MFWKSLVGLLRPERGKIFVDGTNIIECSAKELYEIRTLFGVMFQDSAVFGSMSLYDNTAFPLREHTKKKESEIRQIVMEKLDLVGLTGDETKFPGEVSGGMRSALPSGSRARDHAHPAGCDAGGHPRRTRQVPGQCPSALIGRAAADPGLPGYARGAGRVADRSAPAFGESASCPGRV